MKRLMAIEVLAGVLALSCAAQGKPQGQPLKGKKALLIIAPHNFRDEEYKYTRQELEKAGMTVTVASTTTRTATGMLGMKTRADILIGQAKSADYDLVALPGGSGVKVFYDNQQLLGLLRQAYKAGKVMGAICLAPVVLAKAGLLQGKKATCWSGAKDTLRSFGVTVLDRHVVTDGRIVTADGPSAAHAFGKTLVKVLQEQSTKGGKK